MIHPPTNRRERILLYGRSNSGKSSSWLSVADWMVRTQSTDTHVFVGDTDRAWDAMRGEDTALEEVVQVTDLDLERYRDWITWARDIRGTVQPHDWLVVDMIDKAWEGAQSYFWEQKGGIDLLADVWMTKTKGEVSGAHGENWGIINKYYNAFFQLIVNMPCHVLCVARASEVREDERAEVKNQFKVGWKPQGQKDLTHGFHTVLFAAETPQGWIYTTVRERGPIGREGRRYLKGEKVDDFVTSYLFGVAGWKP